MNKTTKLITIISIIFFAVSCKKENQNDVNIDDRILNANLSVITTGRDTVIDIDGDGYFEFKLYSSFPGSVPINSEVGIFSFSTGNMDFDFSVETIGIVDEMAKVFTENSEINASTGTWNDFAVFYYNDTNIPTGKLGFNDVGDKYIGIRTRNRMVSVTDYYYGWMKVNVSGTHSVSVKSFAVNKIKNTGIKAGTI